MRAALAEVMSTKRVSGTLRSATNFVKATGSRVSMPLCPPHTVSMVSPASLYALCVVYSSVAVVASRPSIRPAISASRSSANFSAGYV